LCALVVAAAWLPLRVARAADAPAATGRVLLLANEHTLEGDIERDGDQYRVRRALGETWVPADQVLCLCASHAEAYAFLCTRANLRDADERLRLARWCLLYGLRAQALAEATAAVELRPHMAEGRLLLRNLQRSMAAAADQPAPGSKIEDRGSRIEDRGSVAGDETELPTSWLLPMDVSVEALSLFATRVQPILMNTCVACHATGKAGAFRLTRAEADGTLNRRATQHNLVAVLSQVNRERPAASPLLLKAVSVHGEASQAPLKSRQTPAFRSLEEWVRLAVASNPQPQQQPEPKLESLPQPAPTLQAPLPGEVISAPSAASIRSAGSAPAALPREATPPSAEVGPVDPFDPVIFNRQMHLMQEARPSHP
jgi:hypothetical protein